MSEHVTIGRYGAFMTTDKTSRGYYIVHWHSIPYTLQDDFELNDYDPPIILKAGELVCNGEYMNPMPQTKLWYTQPHVPIRTKIRMKHVVKSECTMHPSSAENKMTHSCSRTPLGAMKLNAEDELS